MKMTNSNQSAMPRVTTKSDLNAGRVAGTFGLRGECKIDASRIGADALGPGVIVSARMPDGSTRELRVRTVRMHKGRPLAAFEGFNDATEAEALTGALLSVDRADVSLREGEYLDADLIGCTLVDTSREVGTVVAVEHYPAQDMLVIGTSRALVPMVAEFVKSIDIINKRIDVALPAGLIDERDAERA